jgi:hypothetical protein
MLQGRLFRVSLLLRGVFFALVALCLSHAEHGLAQSAEAVQNYPFLPTKKPGGYPGF